MADMVTELRTNIMKNRKFALFGDNAKINVSLKMRHAARAIPGLPECRLLFNQPYRPDLSKSIFHIPYRCFQDGVEHCWGFCKRLYKSMIANIRVQ